MPNWCENNLIIISNDKDSIKKIYDENKSDIELDFTCICPIPEKLNDSSISESEKIELEKKYGHSNWYDWCLSNWGTKWNASEVSYAIDPTGCELIYNFCTAWNPPTVWLDEFIKKYSGCINYLELEYQEPGMDIWGKITCNMEGRIMDQLIESDSLESHIWNNCDRSLILNNVKEMNEKHNDLCDDEITDYVCEEITDYVCEELSDQIKNVHCIHSRIKQMVEHELIEYKNNKNNKYNILKLTDKVKVHKIEI
tara:strand:+ start:107 stop:868 length:762 start_codon:yes stop_codon:yes gene_type:complete